MEEKAKTTRALSPTRGIIPGDRKKSSPLAKAMARSHGLNLAGIKGTGPGGRIVRDDILRNLKEKEAVAKKQGAVPMPVDKSFPGTSCSTGRNCRPDMIIFVESSF